ncbi:MAG: DUF5615 family PIN-like protein [Cyclobacteriaceae bacterium]|nr:DUF5615 family PIN-like protein [Cyclobacteriaceae bacterium]
MSAKIDIWIDAQLSPSIALWLNQNFDFVTAQSFRSLGYRDSNDLAIFMAAKAQRSIIMTKDSDFINWLKRLGSPPQIILVTCGNTSNTRLKEILLKTFTKAYEMILAGEQFVEIKGD